MAMVTLSDLVAELRRMPQAGWKNFRSSPAELATLLENATDPSQQVKLVLTINNAFHEGGPAESDANRTDLDGVRGRPLTLAVSSRRCIRARCWI